MTNTKTKFPVGSWERPDAGGIVRRGEGVSEFFKDYATTEGGAPRCFAGHEFGCKRESVMEVYGLFFCEAHGEEAASAALEEIDHDLEQYLDLNTSTHRSGLSPHIKYAMRVARDTVSGAGGIDDAALLAAYPLDEKSRERVEAETFMYVEEPDRDRLSPYDMHLMDRHLVCRHMRLAFEEDATWLVEMLERQREHCASQAAYALALDRDAGLQ